MLCLVPIVLVCVCVCVWVPQLVTEDANRSGVIRMLRRNLLVNWTHLAYWHIDFAAKIRYDRYFRNTVIVVAAAVLVFVVVDVAINGPILLPIRRLQIHSNTYICCSRAWAPINICRYCIDHLICICAQCLGSKRLHCNNCQFQWRKCAGSESKSGGYIIELAGHWWACLHNSHTFPFAVALVFVVDASCCCLPLFPSFRQSSP